MRVSPWSGPGRWLGAVALFVAVAVVGCKPGGGKGIVTGKVTYKGAPLKGGRVVFSTSNKQGSQADIGEDGTYTTPEMATGPAKIGVETSYLNRQTGRIRNQPPKDAKMPEGYTMAGGGGDAKRYVKIPDQYEKADTSGLTYDVKSGKQTHDIELK
jgi:hypothetical protein